MAGAVASHREAIKLRPDDARLHAALGHTLSTAGDLEGAIASHRQAIACNPPLRSSQRGPRHDPAQQDNR